MRELDAWFINEYDTHGEEVELVEVSKNAQGTVSLTKVVTKPGQGVLSDAQVREIRKLLKQGSTVAYTARTVGTSERTVARIRDGETYTNVK